MQKGYCGDIFTHFEYIINAFFVLVVFGIFGQIFVSFIPLLFSVFFL